MLKRGIGSLEFLRSKDPRRGGGVLPAHEPRSLPGGAGAGGPWRVRPRDGSLRITRAKRCFPSLVVRETLCGFKGNARDPTVLLENLIAHEPEAC